MLPLPLISLNVCSKAQQETRTNSSSVLETHEAFIEVSVGVFGRCRRSLDMVLVLWHAKA